ncbi:polysaccharide deacetylase family protein [Luteibacter aegosomatissinici]|uniref:polysaccharide deacetylase family protein n=1 Tax=Luteibacter aegosomatissinici TaxID=2911539 RepID=UPI001FFA2D8F|nr:polysaccharide deacetylase family protein [Luteibacter aegosomatissinici]UPG96600.1 polysaccharide deacetylase family protein [Luteibacter aegosomatissinici]
MSLATLMYHDVVAAGRWDDSGFPGSAAAHYKLDTANFLAHLDALRAAGTVFAEPDAVAGGAFDGCLLTYDDGGASASAAGEAMLQRGVRGCFFITTSRIGTTGFVSAQDLRALRQDGHLIGSHSHTHPANISQLDSKALHDEWRRSVDTLEQILGERVHTASVPGGFMSMDVLRAAEVAGICTLFTSEPTTRDQHSGTCAVLGRYALLRESSPAMAVALASGEGGARLKQWAAWNVKKPLKRWAGPVYRFARARLLHERIQA